MGTTTIRKSEILWYNASTGHLQAWLMDGHRIDKSGDAPLIGLEGTVAHVGPPWTVVGAGDFNGDRKADILWHNSETQETQIWYMDGLKLFDRGTVLGHDGQAVFIGPPFSIVAVGDFDGDGKADILWHNNETLETQIWYMDGHQLVRRGTVLGHDGQAVFIGPPFSIVGAGDFDGDGKADILWHNSETLETQIWYMDGHQLIRRGTVLGEDRQAAFIGPPFSIVGVADFDGDGKADILWHHSDTHETQVWYMDGHQLVRRGTVLSENGQPVYIGPPFSIVASAVAITTEIPDVALRFVGFRCFGVTDGPGDDDPYFTFGVVPLDPSRKGTHQTGIYDSIPAGSSHPDSMELYRGIATGVTISVTLVEHDHGDPNKYRGMVEGAVNTAAEKVSSAIASVPKVGWALVLAAQAVFAVVLPKAIDALNSLLGTDDDQIGTVSFGVTPEDMARLARAERQDFFGIHGHLETPLISGKGASYKAYFDLVPV